MQGLRSGTKTNEANPPSLQGLRSGTKANKTNPPTFHGLGSGNKANNTPNTPNPPAYLPACVNSRTSTPPLARSSSFPFCTSPST